MFLYEVPAVFRPPIISLTKYYTNSPRLSSYKQTLRLQILQEADISYFISSNFEVLGLENLKDAYPNSNGLENPGDTSPVSSSLLPSSPTFGQISTRLRGNLSCLDNEGDDFYRPGSQTG